jgi:SanA protein
MDRSRVSVSGCVSWFGRRWLRLLLGVTAVLALWLGLTAWRVGGSVAPFVSADRDALPTTKVGLVLGCSEQVAGGRKNLYFERRMAAAAELFHSGKVRYLLVSGDNSRADYDEPSDMQRALVAAGVPASRIVLDYAGFRTLDSVVRAKQVFGLSELIVVSQRFHNERAVYLARAHGIRAYGYNARDVGGSAAVRTRLREVVSRLVAVLDVELLHSSPRFGGPREPAAFD